MDASQHGWLKRNHPELAQAWREPGRQGQSFRPSPESQSQEKWSPGSRLPRKGGAARDFAHLSPTQFKRHPGQDSEKDSMEETGVQAAPGGRPGLMRLPEEHPPLRKRDILVAERK